MVCGDGSSTLLVKHNNFWMWLERWENLWRIGRQLANLRFILFCAVHEFFFFSLLFVFHRFSANRTPCIIIISIIMCVCAFNRCPVLIVLSRKIYCSLVSTHQHTTSCTIVFVVYAKLEPKLCHTVSDKIIRKTKKKKKSNLLYLLYSFIKN